MSPVTGTRSLLAGALLGLVLAGCARLGSDRPRRRVTPPRCPVPSGATSSATPLRAVGPTERAPGTYQVTIVCPSRAALEVRVSVGGRAGASTTAGAVPPDEATVTVRLAAPRDGRARTVDITPVGTSRAYVAYDVAQVA